MTSIKFSIKIEPTTYDWSWIYLRATLYWWFIPMDSIIIKSDCLIPNGNVEDVAKSWLRDAPQIWEDYKKKPRGVFEHGSL